MDIALLLFTTSLTIPLILYKQALLTLNLDIICLSFLGVLLADSYYVSSIAYVLLDRVAAIAREYRGINNLIRVSSSC